jgi:tyrosine-protein phosphatase SIW14
MVVRLRCFIPFIIFSLPAFAGSQVQSIHNFRQVDEHVYRGAQPTIDGYKYLAQIGVKTVLDLRQNGERSSVERREVTALGMQYVNVPMSGLMPPTSEQMTKILGLLEDHTAGAVFVHCKRGADRTGAVIAAYRIDHYHWDNTRALKEAMSDGMRFFQLPRQSFIRNFQPLTVSAATASSLNPTKAETASAPFPAAATPAVP